MSRLEALGLENLKAWMSRFSGLEALGLESLRAWFLRLGVTGCGLRLGEGSQLFRYSRLGLSVVRAWCHGFLANFLRIRYPVPWPER